MGDKRRLAYVKGEAITALRIQRGFTQFDLAGSAGVHEDTIKRAENDPDYRMQVRNINAVAVSLGVKPFDILRSTEPSGTLPVQSESYTWERIMTGARKVGEQAFSDTGFCADAVLTFPGASAIFAHLVLAKSLPKEKFVRLPVYTAVLVDKENTGPWPGFTPVPTKCFNILIPSAMLQDRTKRIVVIEDTIISGGAMDELRELFEATFDEGNVKFACCICHDSLAFGNRTAPEFLGIEQLETRRKFEMPWGIESYRYEEIFCADAKAEEYSKNPIAPTDSME